MNTHINKNKKKKDIPERSYSGVTITSENYREILKSEGRDGINFHTKHLRAYLKGKKQFRHKMKRNEDGTIVYDTMGFPIWNIYNV